MLNLIIYNINSFGGNYEYSKWLARAYSANSLIDSCALLMPLNADVNGANVLKILYPDIPRSSNKLFRKFHFIYRSFVNPFRLFIYLVNRQSSVVLFNDFDQVTAIFWIPFFKWLKRKHHFAVILHDPDRDKFFPIKLLSEISMSSIMSLMDIAFYHGYLPEKAYYKGNFSRVEVPHGIFTENAIDDAFLSCIKRQAGKNFIIGLLGNIREEKNYELILEALALLENVTLLIAGKPAHSRISVAYLKEYATAKRVNDKVIWKTGYLSHDAFNAAIAACDIVLLYYKPSFTSQSGVLNKIASFYKMLIVSDTESSLKKSVEKYKLGSIVPCNDINSLVRAVNELLHSNNVSDRQNWERYMHDSSWERHVSIAVEQYKTLR